MVWPQERYLEAAEQARAYVRAGDVFQVNLSHPFRGSMPGVDAPFALMSGCPKDSPAAYSAYLRLDETGPWSPIRPSASSSCAPTGQVETRPIKGTRPRRDDPAADAAEIAALRRPRRIGRRT
jgi:para-aminobenzoate synthetase component 1